MNGRLLLHADASRLSMGRKCPLCKNYDVTCTKRGLRRSTAEWAAGAADATMKPGNIRLC